MKSFILVLLLILSSSTVMGSDLSEAVSDLENTILEEEALAEEKRNHVDLEILAQMIVCVEQGKKCDSKPIFPGRLNELFHPLSYMRKTIADKYHGYFDIVASSDKFSAEDKKRVAKAQQLYLAKVGKRDAIIKRYEERQAERLRSM